MTDAPPYDPDLRRDTPLAQTLEAQIERSGPMSLAQYMRACLWHEQHGYYATRTPVGAAGDFITAPEISQVFGELIGLWAAVVWQQMGAPPRFTLAEAGPGRGTMMRDALRAADRVPGWRDAARIVLVEKSPALRAAQCETLSAHADRIAWSATGEGLDPPLILLANEFLDCLPVEQAVKTVRGWELRCVTVDAAGTLAFGFDPRLGTVDSLAAPFRDAPPDSVLEFAPDAMPPWLGDAARRGPVAGLFIDYGHAATGLGETLQAVRRHRHEHVLTSPGEADLSAHVDFAAFAAAARNAGLAVDGPVTQAEFLGRLGIMERAARLMSANPSKANDIETGVARLMNPQGMGTRFKVLGMRSPSAPILPAF
jgi:SAM-dependent MidA family methyltransferase